MVTKTEGSLRGKAAHLDAADTTGACASCWRSNLKNCHASLDRLKKNMQDVNVIKLEF